MGLFDKRKKKKLIEEINHKRRNLTFPKLDDLDDSFLKYDYSILLQLEEDDFMMQTSCLHYLIYTISLVGHKLKNVNIIELNDSDAIKKLLHTKDDFLHLDELCSKYNIEIIQEFIETNEINNILDITPKKINELILKKKEKEEIEKCFKDIHIEKPKEINTMKEAINYSKMYSFLLKHNINLQFNQGFKFTKLFANLELEKLSEIDKKNLLEYVYIVISNRFDIQLNTLEDLINYEEIKQNAIDKLYAKDKTNSLTLFYKIGIIKNLHDFRSIVYEANNLDKITSLGKEVLMSKYEFDSKEVELIEILSQIQSDESCIPRLYEKYKENGENFKDIDYLKFRQKIRVIYASEISSSLTKLNDLSGITYLGTEKYVVPTYEKESGKFKFLVHAIVNDTPNRAIANLMGNKSLFKNPELWDKIPRENGTIALSTSIISSEGTPCIIANDIVYYGFDELDAKSIRNMNSTDAATSHEINGIDRYGGREKMQFSDDLIEDSHSREGGFRHNEVAFSRYNNDGTVKKPRFILCFDTVNNESIKHADYHKIPILIIRTKKYLDDFEQRIIASKNNVINCDKNNIVEYYNALKNLLKEIQRYQSLYYVTFEKDGRGSYSEDLKLVKKELKKIVESNTQKTEVSNGRIR